MYAAELLDSCTLRFTEEQRNNVRNLVSEANTVLRGIADGMPDGLALYLSRLLRETETALDEYAITGDFVLARAVSRLRAALDIGYRHLVFVDGILGQRAFTEHAAYVLAETHHEVHIQVQFLGRKLSEIS